MLLSVVGAVHHQTSSAAEHAQEEACTRTGHPHRRLHSWRHARGPVRNDDDDDDVTHGGKRRKTMIDCNIRIYVEKSDMMHGSIFF